MNFRQFLKASSLLILVLLAAGGLGCAMFRQKPTDIKDVDAVSAPVIAAANKLRYNDNLVIRLDTATGREEHQKIIDENGTIELPYVGVIKLADLTITQAQEAVRKVYVPRYYSYLTVTITLQTPRFIYLSGEVRGQTGALPYREDMTVYRAIQAGGGLGEFAKKREVVLTRNNKRIIVDCVEIEKHPELDIPVLPGDNIYVPKSNF
jgi:protein involved in polysaccharide export with SLBB domain